MQTTASFERSGPPSFYIGKSNLRNAQFETPIDDRGLVLVPELIEMVKAATLTDFTELYWDGNDVNVHHFYWPEAEYKAIPSAGKPHPGYFRDLPINKGLVPKSFHKKLHEVSRPPPIPSREVMGYRIDAYNCAKSLFKSARATIQTLRMAKRREIYISNNPEVLKPEFEGVDVIGKEIIQEFLEQNFEGFEIHLRRAERVPEEFQLVKLGDNDNSIRNVATALGKLVAPRAVNLLPILTN